uniref:Uncharacterized protein n=1 Tax=Arundo donax TaxID=35708 RepID=A0A0A8YFI6_ARUDO
MANIIQRQIRLLNCQPWLAKRSIIVVFKPVFTQKQKEIRN